MDYQNVTLEKHKCIVMLRFGPWIERLIVGRSSEEYACPTQLHGNIEASAAPKTATISRAPQHGNVRAHHIVMASSTNYSSFYEFNLSFLHLRRIR